MLAGAYLLVALATFGWLEPTSWWLWLAMAGWSLPLGGSGYLWLAGAYLLVVHEGIRHVEQ